MLHPFEQQLIGHWPTTEWSDVTVQVAVSGGADSMALLRAMRAVYPESHGRLMVVHFNHRLRGAESDRDESFVRESCDQLGLRCLVAAAADIRGTEELARRARYDFFQQAARQHGARYVVTAHTADDQAETILHRILRGTGIDGLAGIPKSRELVTGVSLLRPILWATRAEILEYLQAIEQPFRQDSSNIDTRFTRNRLRHDLIPLLERDYNPRVREALLRLGELAADTQKTISTLVDEVSQATVSPFNDQEVTLSCTTIRATHPHVIRQTLIRIWQDRGWPLQGMTAEHWRKLCDLISAAPRGTVRAVFPSGISAECDGSTLRLFQQ